MKVGREPVVRAGLKLLDEVGLDSLTLRAIAAELGIQAPTLYWRFKNKQDLVDEMATQVLADWVASAGEELPAKNWAARSVNFGRGLRQALLRYRDGARMVAGSRLTDGVILGPMEVTLQLFVAAGISPDDATVFLSALYCFVIGFTLEEQAVITPQGQRHPEYELSAREARIDAQRFPLVRSIGASLFDNYDARFERGLRMLIAGFAAEQRLAVPATKKTTKAKGNEAAKKTTAKKKTTTRGRSLRGARDR